MAAAAAVKAGPAASHGRVRSLCSLRVLLHELGPSCQLSLLPSMNLQRKAAEMMLVPRRGHHRCRGIGWVVLEELEVLERLDRRLQVAGAVDPM
eukprot:COSAG01_NODE_959_length_12451_cov_18.389815_11_plen_94_part_00